MAGRSWRYILKLYFLSALASIANFIRFVLPGGPWLWSRFLDPLSLALIDCCRLFSGRFRAAHIERCARPQAPLILYEYEACPYCRKVRETLSVLDIDHYVYPCPRETLKSAGVCINSRFRPVVSKQGGSLSFPFLVDPTTDRKIYESDLIIKYLWETYGDKAAAPLNYRIAHWPPYRNLSMKICAFFRPCQDMGLLRAPSHKPQQPLEIWGFEGSCHVRRVREVLSALELPYFYHQVPVGADKKREEFIELCLALLPNSDCRSKCGLLNVPLMRDPNTKVEMFDSSSIVKYLCKRYQTAPVPEESWLEFGAADKMKTK